jgi:hypothetical protein
LKNKNKEQDKSMIEKETYCRQKKINASEEAGRDG